MKFPYILVLFIAFISFSCEYGHQAEDQLNKLQLQTEDLDALINEGIEKVTELDTILPQTSKRLKEADSIFKDASSTLESLKQKVDDIQNLIN